MRVTEIPSTVQRHRYAGDQTGWRSPIASSIWRVQSEVRRGVTTIGSGMGHGGGPRPGSKFRRPREGSLGLRMETTHGAKEKNKNAPWGRKKCSLRTNERSNSNVQLRITVTRAFTNKPKQTGIKDKSKMSSFRLLARKDGPEDSLCPQLFEP